jgi:hypothetical protein
MQSVSSLSVALEDMWTKLWWVGGSFPMSIMTAFHGPFHKHDQQCVFHERIPV